MAKTLEQYAEWLEERNLRWPAPPKVVSAKATPYLKPLKGIRGVTWGIYGTLLRISEGELLFEHPQRLRMQVALEKTVEEFNMWNSMYRKPGAPWEYMLEQYTKAVEDQRMAATKHKGDVPEVNSARTWRKLLGQLEQKDYEYDHGFYGDMDELSEKVAFFFHASLQGIEAAPNALTTLMKVSQARIPQGLLADGQSFTLVQMLRALRRQGTLPPLGKLFAPSCVTLSFQEGVRKPSLSLYRACVERFERLDIAPGEVLHVGTRLRDDLAVAKRVGMRTALYTADKTSLQASQAEMKDPELKPDRLVTDLSQVCDILGIG